MKKSLQDLLDEGLVEEFTSTPLQIKEKMNIAQADVDLAKADIVNATGRAVDWVYTKAYNAMLQAGTALMYSRGYRSKKRSGSHHFSVERFLKSEFDHDLSADVLNAFGVARSSRHATIYDEIGTISKSQAEYLIAQAESLIISAKLILKID